MYPRPALQNVVSTLLRRKPQDHYNPDFHNEASQSMQYQLKHGMTGNTTTRTQIEQYMRNEQRTHVTRRGRDGVSRGPEYDDDGNRLIDDFTTRHWSERERPNGTMRPNGEKTRRNLNRKENRSENFRIKSENYATASNIQGRPDCGDFDHLRIACVLGVPALVL